MTVEQRQSPVVSLQDCVSHEAMSFSKSKRGSSGSVTTGVGVSSRMLGYHKDEPGLTATFGSPLLLLPSLFGTNDKVFALVFRVVNLLLVMGFLQCPSMPDTVKHAGEKSCISNNLKERLGRSRTRREWTGTDVHSWGCHSRVLNERASG